MHRKIAIGALLAVVVLSLGLPANAAKPNPIPRLTPDGVTHHHITINGRALNYTARAGTLTLRNGEDQPTARVFYTAYTLDVPSRHRGR